MANEIFTNFNLFLNSRTGNVTNGELFIIIVIIINLTSHSSGVGDVVMVRIFDVLIQSQQSSQSLLVLGAGQSLHINNGALTALQTLLTSNC